MISKRCSQGRQGGATDLWKYQLVDHVKLVLSSRDLDGEIMAAAFQNISRQGTLIHCPSSILAKKGAGNGHEISFSLFMDLSRDAELPNIPSG